MLHSITSCTLLKGPVGPSSAYSENLLGFEQGICGLGGKCSTSVLHITVFCTQMMYLDH